MRIKIHIALLFTFLLAGQNLLAQDIATLKGKLINLKKEPLPDVAVYLETTGEVAISDTKGHFAFKLKNNNRYRLIFQSLQIESFEKTILLQGDTTITLNVAEKVQNLQEVVITSKADAFGIRQLRSIEGGGLYEGKKTEVINIKKLVANKATNNARQTFSKVPSLNIWESDCAGLQLDIGGRGLSPKRTSNFNTRQNGYDISADPLGYPESYYTPPLQAVDQIEVVRGAGALQYGSQFGGLINFKLRKGSTDKPINFESENTYGSFNFINSFNSLHGQYKKLNHYSYVQYKQGDCYRCNSGFEMVGAYTGLEYQATKRLKLGFDFTHMSYLAQQAGGLTDEQFAVDHLQSTRERNWFKVNWTLPAFQVEYQINPSVKLYSRTYGLVARRSSLGLLRTPDQTDEAGEDGEFINRDLIDGRFRNLGNETRLTYTYDTQKKLKNALLIGTKVFAGSTEFDQFLGTTGTDADFQVADTAIVDRRKSDFEFPSRNIAVFAESIFRLSESFSIIPGLRYEYIDTRSSGVLTTPVRINSFGDVIEQDSSVTNRNSRGIFLYGLGLSQKFDDKYELYSNATANYRAINFSDIQIQTNTQLVDTLISDESGYSFDLGVRKLDFDPFFVEASVFYLLYNDRIGEVLDDGLRVRTNIGSGNIFGLELYAEVDVFKLLKKEVAHRLSYFVNGSLNSGIYTKINERSAGAVRDGNRLEDIPKYNIKTGINYGMKDFSVAIQSTFIGEQFSDAANTRVNLSPLRESTGVFGEIPAYMVVDLSAQYRLSPHFVLAGSVNNLLNEKYFSRRATAYPGPGIIPSGPRTFYMTVKMKF